MDQTRYPEPDAAAAVIWHALAQGREHRPAGARYWNRIARRPRSESVVLQYSVAGRIRLRHPGGDQEVAPGSFFTCCQGDPVSYGHPRTLPEAYICRWINLGGAGLTDHVRLLICRHGHCYPLGTSHPLVARFDQLLTRAHPRSETPRARLAEMIHQFVMSLMEAVEDRAAASHSPAQQAIQHILDRPLRAGSLKEIAGRFDVSREHLSRCFQEQVGEPPHPYLARVRGRHALQLLRGTQLPLREVAEQTGHSGPHHLLRRVRELTGLTPTAYRAAARSDAG